MKDLQPPRGTYDALPEKSAKLRYIEMVASRVLESHGFGEIRTPIFEFTDVFARSVGEATDIVTKEMYTFNDRNGESITLRPENTAAVVRAYYSNGLKQHLPLKLSYIGAPMFRYERPQKGRYRQFHQIGIETFGVAEPWADIDVISAGVNMMRALNIGGEALVKLNSLGTPEDRQRYRDVLLNYFKPHFDKLSKESQERLEKNPLRVLDSKEEQDQELVKDAPMPIDYLGEEASAHFEAVKKGLDALGVKYEIVPSLVRGLDYYTHTVFEIHGEGLGAQSQVIGGGRYDGLVELMGGESVPGVGFGCGVERLEMLLPDDYDDGRPASITVVVVGDEARLKALPLADELRAQLGRTVHMALNDISFKAQFKRADKNGSSHVVVIGKDEASRNVVQLKDMETGEQIELALSDLPQHLLAEIN